MTNVVVLLADDLGFGDLNPTFMPRCYALMQSMGTQLDLQTSFACAPTRAALMTGVDPSIFGSYGDFSPPNYPGVPVEQVLLPELLQDAGYATGIFGKWHLGLTPEQGPWNNGFDQSVGFMHGFIEYYGSQPNMQRYPDNSLGHDHHGGHDMLVDGVPIRSSQYSTFLFEDAAREFITDQAAEGQPFFAYVPFNAPHQPYAAPRAYIDLYLDTFGITPTDYALLPVYAEDVMGLPPQASVDPVVYARLEQLVYYAAVRALDDAVADIYQSVIDAGVAGDTLFLFSSDNGARSYPESVGDSGGLRGGKGSVYEGAHRTANFIIWPEEIDAGETVDGNIWIGDMFPTILTLAGVEIPPETTTTNILPILNGTADQELLDRFVIPHIRRVDPATELPRADITILSGDIKYIRIMHYDAVDREQLLNVTEYLFDLGVDLAETTSVLDDPAYAEVLASLRGAYEAYGRNGLTGDDFMASLPIYEGAPWAGYAKPKEWGAPQITNWNDPSLIHYGSGSDDSMIGQDDTDIIWGNAGDDLLGGAGGNDYLVGGKGTDTIYGGTGDDTLDAGSGLGAFQVLTGGAGHDTYLFGKGQGKVLIKAGTGQAADGDVFVFTDLQASQIGFRAHQGNILRADWSAGGQTGQVRMEVMGNAVDTIVFADGASVLRAEVLGILGNELDNRLTGTAGHDVLNGLGGTDILTGGAGNDTLDAGLGAAAFQTLRGGLGDDLYRYSREDGRVQLDGLAETASSGVDSLIFTDLLRSDLQVHVHQGNILRLDWAIAGQTGQIRLAALGAHIESIVFADGQITTAADLLL